jgi:hypothetical protein
MTINHVTITGADPAQEKAILDDVLYIEGLFFRDSFPVLTNHTDSEVTKDESSKAKPESTNNTSPSKTEAEAEEDTKPHVQDSSSVQSDEDANEDEDEKNQ